MTARRDQRTAPAEWANRGTRMNFATITTERPTSPETPFKQQVVVTLYSHTGGRGAHFELNDDFMVEDDRDGILAYCLDAPDMIPAGSHRIRHEDARYVEVWTTVRREPIRFTDGTLLA